MDKILEKNLATVFFDPVFSTVAICSFDIILEIYFGLIAFLFFHD